MESIVVVGAGCFGAWTAWHLARRGLRVTLIDAYGPGNTRSSSGGETRVIRMGYGAQEIYTLWSLRSLTLWKELSARSPDLLFHVTGFLWMAHERDPLSTATLATLQRVGIPHERIDRAGLESRWPQIDSGPVAWAMFEPESGVLMARRAVDAVAREAVEAGADLRTGDVLPPRGEGRLDFVATRAGEKLDADAFVFACGPWLPKLFPEMLGERIFVTQQEVYYFGVPAGSARFAPPAFPAWIDFRDEVYGVPDIEARGFKVALDRHGPPFDPDRGDRTGGETLAEVRRIVAKRFPALGDAPLLATEVCQYENTSNGDFLIDRHPDLDNVWLVGGGSGHGFKHSPAVGENVAQLVTEGGDADDRFRIATKGRVQERAVY
jgi:monomeric sarcosine oxidase